MGQDNEYIAFLVNFFESTIPLPAEIIPGVILRRATVHEKEIFRPYDEAAHFDKVDTRISRTTIPFGPGATKTETNDDFRGYVLQFGLRIWGQYGNQRLSIYDQLQLACSISESGLRPVLVCAVGRELQPYFFTHDLHRHTVLRRRALGAFLKKIPQLTAADLAEIRAVTNYLQDLSAEHGFVLEAIERFQAVELISLDSDFHTFGLFTILEYLLTHPPVAADRSDSLTKQISQKAPSVAKTFDNCVSATGFFQITSEEKAWKILYGYRSAIAHGGSINFSKPFSKGGYSELRDRNQVEAFLYLFTRKLLKSALRDPKRILLLKRE